MTVLEGAERVGGKLYGGEVGGVRTDLGAEALLALRPEAVALAGQAGLGGHLEPPVTTRSAIWTRGALRPLPERQLMGLPGDLDALAASGVLSEAGLARARRDLSLPRTAIGDDIALGAYVRTRVGREVVDRLVEPLLGGVYAGQADRISLRAALPRLLPAVQEERSLVAAVRRLLADRSRDVRATGPAAPHPVFQGIRGGVGRLPGAVAAACRSAGAEVRTGTAARRLRRTPDGWWLGVAGPGGAEELTADAVVLAVPAPAAAGLLAEDARSAAADLRAVEYARMALVTLVFRRADLPDLPGGGFLVPPVEGRTVKAATFLSNKWGWLADAAPDHVVVRTSVGRHGEETAAALDDAELVSRSLAELRPATGLDAVPYATAVTRWATGLPQYPVGHPDRVARIRARLAELGPVTVCGAAYDGVGVPSCIAGGWQAAADVTAALRPHSAA
ncbi:protoporphyrinogen oxidase [Streptomyces sp. SB3404]|uniref:Coproporphyrinogen III oxidase n=1 Tax=Streptomyces boncukensis TaxID=2711219 RepID=A0A6G4X724_9ACTN|nr:protoporphyrinogen oxidase [Streptomyces boncukensis]